MKTRSIGQLTVSVVGLGTNNFGTDFFGKECDQDEVTDIIGTALDAGVTLIDTAEEYSTRCRHGIGRSEQFIGVALGPRRDEVVIASKFMVASVEHPDQTGAERIVTAVEGSLRRLGTDRIDLYQQHFPDPRTPIDETLRALDQLVRQGKVREIGCSNFSGEQIDEARLLATELGIRPFVSTQNNCNVLDRPREPGVIEACQRHDMMLLPYFPLASGLLTGKYRRGAAPGADSRMGNDSALSTLLRETMLVDDRLDKAAELERLAREHGHTLLELALSWLASQPFVGSIIAGATRADQMAANAAAASSWELSDEDLSAVAAITGWDPRLLGPSTPA